MKVLCICDQGNKRAVFTRFLLGHKHEALAAGVKTNSPETINLLCEWADKILLAELNMREYIPENYWYKIDNRFEIGPDIYKPSIRGHLKRIVRYKLRELGYI
jgi:hypothetical protein